MEKSLFKTLQTHSPLITPCTRQLWRIICGHYWQQICINYPQAD